ncbi:MAG TPA: trans-aconitate 2-methyltransferase [Mycobacteriales bacterium]|nr:trans-aconitate 2-methyltransferase [Mycobacteriales bacterium]
MWDPATYQQFSFERERPFAELLSRVAHPDPSYVVDLGCGPGGRTATLLQRWPQARVVGVDSSAEMVSTAAEHAVDGRLSFVQGDLRTWQPEQAVDVLVTNATLQWVPGHLDLLPRLVGFLTAGGEFAMQVPGNFTEPSHLLLEQLRSSPRWRDRVGPESAATAAVHAPADYLAALTDLGLTADVWETTYLHVLPGPDAVLEWTKGTALRPVFAVLSGDEREEFVREYAALLRAAYPRRSSGTVLPFRRIFAVAQRPPA